jgi:acyl-CoA thioester hydrolase
MLTYQKPIILRWSDLDPNYHVRHSVYYDLAAQMRVEILNETGITLKLMQEQQFGPILFREECVFRKELRYGDNLMIDIKLLKANADFSRWSMQHQFIRDNETVCATLTIDGAWINTQLRKLTIPPQAGIDALAAFPKAENFSMM